MCVKGNVDAVVDEDDEVAEDVVGDDALPSIELIIDCTGFDKEFGRRGLGMIRMLYSWNHVVRSVGRDAKVYRYCSLE